MKLLIKGRVYKKWRHLKDETIANGTPVKPNKNDFKRFVEFSTMVNSLYELGEKVKTKKIKDAFSFEFLQKIRETQSNFYDNVKEG